MGDLSCTPNSLYNGFLLMLTLMLIVSSVGVFLIQVLSIKASHIIFSLLNVSVGLHASLDTGWSHPM